MAGEIVLANKEKIVLAVNRNNYRSVVSEVLANRNLIETRDIGDFVGLPVEDYVRAKVETIKLSVFFFNFQQPPFRERQGFRFVRVTYNIPDVNRAKLDWLTIKNACGGAEGYTWGRFRATANLSNGRQMQVYGGSDETAANMLRSLAAFSTAKILTMTVAEEKKEGRRAENKRMYKETTRVYPAFFSVLNFEKVVVEEQREYSGFNATLAGDFRRSRTKKIPLWVNKEPSTARAIIIEALRVRGVNQQ
ncbi:hypothetical protein [Nostoc sp. PA-18-2419]|uniref:hypothetical protein n=1 Tax=Nostoc sp. PA-18-2419 TaxID=2575443 RepID=UPI0011080ACE|nr:hypothetical protein [Nostoc sp. PA-18-2419]